MRQTNTVEVRTERANYQVDAVLARSDALSIYQVRRSDGERFAMKLLHHAGDPQGLERFEREVQLGMEMRHPNVVRIRDHGVRSGQPFLIMDLVEGRTLADLHRKGRLTIRESVSRVAELARVVHAAHEHGVVHRDLQPGHVIVSEEGKLLLTGFSLAHDPQSAGLTQEGTMVGTPAYMAPEQVKGGVVDRRTDVYALAVILYELVAGKRPFEGESEAAVLDNVVRVLPRPPSKISPDCPTSLDALVLEAMAKSPSSRPDTAEELAKSLERVLPKLTRLGKSGRSATIGKSGRSATIGKSSRRNVTLPESPVRKSKPVPTAAWVAGGIVGLALLLTLVILVSTSADSQSSDVAESSPTPSVSPESTPVEASPVPSHEPIEEPEPSPTEEAADPWEEPWEQDTTRASDGPDMSDIGEVPEARPQTGQERSIGESVSRLVIGYELYQALEAIEEAAEALPESAWIQSFRAQVLAHHGRYWDAVNALDEAYVLDPGLTEIDPPFDKRIRALAKIASDGGLDVVEAPSPEDWSPVKGGTWAIEEGGTLAGLQPGWGLNSLSLLVNAEALPLKVRLSTRIKLGGLEGDTLGKGSAGLMIGGQNPKRCFMVMIAHMPEMVGRQMGQGQIDAFRNQHGVYPKRVYLGQLNGKELKVINSWTLAFPDSGWVELELELDDHRLLMRVGDWEQRAYLPEKASGRWGLARMFLAEARFRDWELKPAE